MSDSGLRGVTAFVGALGVAAAAFGAHGLEKVASEGGVRLWAIGVAMHLVTVPVALLVAILADKLRPSAGWCLLGGIAIFSGSLYAMALGAPRFFGAVTPLGGLALIAGWLLLAWPNKRAGSA